MSPSTGVIGAGVDAAAVSNAVRIDGGVAIGDGGQFQRTSAGSGQCAATFQGVQSTTSL